jgi:hypothetical protein
VTLLLNHAGIEVHHASWQELAEIVRERGGCDALIVDAPYSANTHNGHDGGERYDGSCVPRGDGEPGHRSKTRGINYAPWTSEDVRTFVETWSPLTKGWLLSITDHFLAIEWQRALEAAGRYAFAPVPLVEIGSRVRLLGDGPSSWTCWLVASRRRDGAWLNGWRKRRQSRGEICTLPGAYVYTGHGDRVVMGGKRLDSMRALVRDYTEPGDRVVDPCCGAGTTLLAARLEGRRAIGGDILLEHAELAAERLRPLPTREDKTRTLALDWDGGDYVLGEQGV